MRSSGAAFLWSRFGSRRWGHSRSGSSPSRQVQKEDYATLAAAGLAFAALDRGGGAIQDLAVRLAGRCKRRIMPPLPLPDLPLPLWIAAVGPFKIWQFA